MLLASDIGGTKTALAIFTPDNGPHAPVVEETFPSARYPSLKMLASEFLAENGLPVDRASFGVSGPVAGGEAAVVERLRSIFETLAPAPDRGWGHVGPSGADHFVKMVHNGVEYGLMQAYAEGFDLMHHKTEFGLDLHQIAEIWRYGSVVRSWLLDLAASSLVEDYALEDVTPYVQDSGEGRWTVVEAIEVGCAIPVITAALEQRFSSQEAEKFGFKLLNAMRNQFGGHESQRKVKPKGA